MTDALKMDGDEVMVDIYESVQDELRMKNKQLMKERQKVCVCASGPSDFCSSVTAFQQ